MHELLTQNLSPEEIKFIETNRIMELSEDNMRSLFIGDKKALRMLKYCIKFDEKEMLKNAVASRLKYLKRITEVVIGRYEPSQPGDWLHKLSDSEYTEDQNLIGWMYMSLEEIEQKLTKFKQQMALNKAAAIAELSELATHHSGSQINVKLLEAKLRLNIITGVEREFVPYLENILIYKETIRALSEYHFNLEDLTVTEKFPSRDVVWQTPQPTYFYFDTQRYEQQLQMLKKLTPPFKTEAAIKAVEQRLTGILPLQNPDVMNLKKMLERYAAIPPTNFNRRRKALVDIAKHAQMILHSSNNFTPDQKQTLSTMAQMCQGKADYLRQIADIPAKTINRMFELDHVKGKPLIQDKKDWFSDIDPLHRQLPYKLYKKWKKTSKQDPSTPNFWVWMETIDQNKLNTIKIDPRYLVKKEEKHVTIKNGVCYNQRCSKRADGRIEDGIYIYNIDKHGDLYILTSPQYFERPHWGQKLKDQGVKDLVNYNHNSILHGEAIKAAGCICFKDGKIVQIDNASGHYLPSMSHVRDAISSLLSKNAFAPGALVTNYFGNKAVPIEEFMAKNFNVTAQFNERRRLPIPAPEVKKLNQQVQAISSKLPAKKGWALAAELAKKRKAAEVTSAPPTPPPRGKTASPPAPPPRGKSLTSTPPPLPPRPKTSDSSPSSAKKNPRDKRK